MKNPVQKMLKAAGQMKNNPQLAQRVAQSPNKVNAIAAQMVIPEQQAMQNSKPIPHPVGSVLMQKLAQAQQAALAAKMPQPSEGGIAQMAAKGGVLKYVGGGYTGTMADVKKVRNKARAEYQAQPTRKEQIAKATEVTPTKLGDLPGMEEFQTEAKTGIAQGIEAQNKATAAAAKAKTKSQKVSQAKTAKMAANFETAVENMGPKPKPKPKVVRKAKAAKAPAPTNTAEQLIAELGSPYEEAKTARETREAYDAEANRRAGEATARANVRKLVEQGQTPAARIPQGRRSIGRGAAPDYRAQGIEQAVRATNVPGPKQVAEGQAAEAESIRKATRAANREAASNALKTQEGRKKLDGTPRVTAESRRQQADIRRENNKKSSIIGEKGKVVPKQPETPEQKARRAKVSSELGLPEKGGIASAASKEARDYMAGKEQPAAPKTEKPAPKPDISREEADTRLASAHAEGQRKKTVQSPATMMGDINDAAHSIITSNPEWADKIAKASAEFNAKNPNATTSERGAYLRSIAPQEAIESLLGQLSPTLEKHGLLFSKEGGIGAPMMEAIDEVAPKATPQSAWNEPKDFKRPAPGPSKLGDTIEGAVNKGAMGLQAYSALAPIANVALDPNKSKADVAREAKYQAVQSSPTIGIGSAVGSGIGESIDKVNEWLGRPKTDYGAALSALGAYGGKGFSGLTRDVMRGKGDESPNLTAKQTLPSVGSLVDTGVEKAKGLYSGIEKAMMDERLPADREREEELQALLAQEEASRGAPATQQTAAPSTPSGTATPVDKTALSRVGKTANPMPSMTEQAPQGRAPAGQTVGYQPSAGGAAAPSVPQAPRTETQATQDQYAGDTSEGTPEGAVQALMNLRGPGYKYSPEVMGMLKDARDEDRQATALSMLAGIGAGLANRDRYAGAHDAALLANQAFTSGREREDAAQQRFLQGIIHNEQVPFEQRQAAYEMYTKMQMAAAQNAALYGRALLNADTRRYGYNMGYAGRVASGGGRDWAEKQDIEGLHIMLKSIDKELESNPNDPFLTAQAKEIRNRLANLSGLSGGKELGQTAQKPIDLDIR